MGYVEQAKRTGLKSVIEIAQFELLRALDPGAETASHWVSN